jgi:hypothetical protein
VCSCVWGGVRVLTQCVGGGQGGVLANWQGWQVD